MQRGDVVIVENVWTVHQDKTVAVVIGGSLTVICVVAGNTIHTYPQKGRQKFQERR